MGAKPEVSQREETTMATLRDIRDAMADDLRSQLLPEDEVREFVDQFNENAHLRTDLLVTTDVEIGTRLYAYADQQLDGSYLTAMRIDQVQEIRHRFM